MKSVINGRSTYYLGKLYQKQVDATSTTIQKYYTSGSAQIAVRTVKDTNDTLQWLLSDHLGSTSTTANTDGTWNSTIQYSAFGEIRTSSGLTPTEYRYTGQLRQPELGLYYYVARWYDPQIGHFVQADTISSKKDDPISYDRYAYVRNNPIKSIDPNGHCDVFLNPADNNYLGEYFTSCVIDIIETVVDIKNGNHDFQTLAIEATGGKNALVKMKNYVDQAYNDRDTVFYSNKPINQRVIPAFRIGWTAVNIGGVVAGGVQGAKAAYNDNIGFWEGDFPSKSSKQYLLRMSENKMDKGFAKYDPDTFGLYRADLEGRAHGNIKPPHIHTSSWNTPPNSEPKFNGWKGEVIKMNPVKGWIISKIINFLY